MTENLITGYIIYLHTSCNIIWKIDLHRKHFNNNCNKFDSLMSVASLAEVNSSLYLT